jgi:hypothetical protein
MFFLAQPSCIKTQISVAGAGAGAFKCWMPVLVLDAGLLLLCCCSPLLTGSRLT